MGLRYDICLGVERSVSETYTLSYDYVRFKYSL